jgi:putative hemolysin
LVSLRGSQVKQLVRRGRRGRLVARLHENPNRFLSAVQIGVTLAGFLSAAFGGTTLADALVPVLQRWLPIGHTVADTIAVVLVTAVISYVSIVLGELTAKRLALQRAEAFAVTLAPLVDFVAKLARPVIWLLGVSTNIAVRLLGGDPNVGREGVSDEAPPAISRWSPTNTAGPLASSLSRTWWSGSWAISATNTTWLRRTRQRYAATVSSTA